MTIDLPPELEQFVAESVRSGDFPTPDDVVRASLRQMLKQHDHKRQELQKLIAEAVEDEEQGRLAPFDAMETLARVKLRAEADERAKGA